MSVINNALLLGQEGGGGYAISRSLRFNSSDSAYLSRTPASAGNRKTWTWAGWVKRSEIGGASPSIWGCQVGAGNPRDVAQFPTDKFAYEANTSGSSWNVSVITTQVFRDASAWYHFVLAVDTTQATAADRIKIFVNGSQITSFSTATYPSQNADLPTNQSQIHYLGASTGANYFNGYLADIHFIDGQALDPTSFGEFDDNGIWQPKAYSGGSYGTNGFHLDFSNNASAAALGTDSAGSNDWTVNNISVASGAGNDSVVDVPTNGSEVDTGAGGQVRGNYCTLNPLDNKGLVLSNGNLDSSSSSTTWHTVRGSIGVSSGKYYWEVTPTANWVTTNSQSRGFVGICRAGALPAEYAGDSDSSWGYYNQSGQKYTSASGSSYGASYVTGDVIGVALNLDSGSVEFYKNGVSQGVAYSGLSAGIYFPAVSMITQAIGAPTATANFGQRPFAYTAPSGFKALCTANLPAPVVTKPSTVMDVLLWTGNGVNGRAVTGLNFSPDFVWIKNRTNPSENSLFDTVRGAAKTLYSNQTAAELASSEFGHISSFDAAGFTLANGSSSPYPNLATNWNASAITGWCWDAGSSTVTNTQGSISSQVRANASAGFSIVTYTGGGAAATVGHGLGVEPHLIITKNRSNGSYGWYTYAKAIGNTNYLILEGTAAATTFNLWQNTTPTSSVFYLSSSAAVTNSGNNFVAYCFAPVAGYNSISSFVGNGSSDGVFVYTGHRVRWLMIKRTDASDSWQIMDAARSDYNVADDQLYADLSNAEASTSTRGIDFLSNGFKVRGNNSGINASGGTYVYVSFAESPFQYARAR